LIYFNILATVRAYFRPLCRIGHAPPEKSGERGGLAHLGQKQGLWVSP
jgi:hypothetical protein